MSVADFCVLYDSKRTGSKEKLTSVPDSRAIYTIRFDDSK